MNKLPTMHLTELHHIFYVRPWLTSRYSPTSDLSLDQTTTSGYIYEHVQLYCTDKTNLGGWFLESFLSIWNADKIFPNT